MESTLWCHRKLPCDQHQNLSLPKQNMATLPPGPIADVLYYLGFCVWYSTFTVVLFWSQQCCSSNKTVFQLKRKTWRPSKGNRELSDNISTQVLVINFRFNIPLIYVILILVIHMIQNVIHCNDIRCLSGRVTQHHNMS